MPRRSHGTSPNARERVARDLAGLPPLPKPPRKISWQMSTVPPEKRADWLMLGQKGFTVPERRTILGIAEPIPEVHDINCE